MMGVSQYHVCEIIIASIPFTDLFPQSENQFPQYENQIRPRLVTLKFRIRNNVEGHAKKLPGLKLRKFVSHEKFYIQYSKVSFGMEHKNLNSP